MRPRQRLQLVLAPCKVPAGRYGILACASCSCRPMISSALSACLGPMLIPCRHASGGRERLVLCVNSSFGASSLKALILYHAPQAMDKVRHSHDTSAAWGVSLLLCRIHCGVQDGHAEVFPKHRWLGYSCAAAPCSSSKFTQAHAHLALGHTALSTASSLGAVCSRQQYQARTSRGAYL